MKNKQCKYFGKKKINSHFLDKSTVGREWSKSDLQIREILMRYQYDSYYEGHLKKIKL